MRWTLEQRLGVQGQLSVARSSSRLRGDRRMRTLGSGMMPSCSWIVARSRDAPARRRPSRARAYLRQRIADLGGVRSRATGWLMAMAPRDNRIRSSRVPQKAELTGDQFGPLQASRFRTWVVAAVRNRPAGVTSRRGSRRSPTSHRWVARPAGS